MFTNISATVIFIARVEMYFHSRYKAYSEAVIGGRLSDIRNNKQHALRDLPLRPPAQRHGQKENDRQTRSVTRTFFPATTSGW